MDDLKLQSFLMEVSMLTFFLTLLVIIVSITLLRRPNFWVGVMIAFAMILLTAGLFWRGSVYVLNAIAKYSITLGLSLFFLELLVLLVLFLGVIIYLIHNTSIMKSREGRSLTSLFSGFLGINIIILILALSLMIIINNRYIKIPLAIFVWEDIFFISLFMSYLIYSVLNQFFNHPTKIDYLIVLGAWSGKKGEIPPLLKSRVDQAFKYYQLNNCTPKFIVSGGQGPDEEVSEATAMRDYLLSLGVPDEQILEENQSTSTSQNMQFSKILIEEDWLGELPPKVVFSTNNYHVLRSQLYAQKIGLKAIGIGSPTSFFFLPSALVREFIALLNYYRKTTIFITLLIAITTGWSFWNTTF